MNGYKTLIINKIRGDTMKKMQELVDRWNDLVEIDDETKSNPNQHHFRFLPPNI